jgi:hypothetical protein
MRFPEVQGRSLSGAELNLPGDFPAAKTLCLIAFQQKHQGCVDRWIALAEASGVPGSPVDMASDDETCVLEIPVISTKWNLGRRFIDGGMTSSIKVPRVLARTVTVYTDVGALQRAMGIADSGVVQACVIARDGSVLVRVPGEPTPGAWDAIAGVLNT